MDRHLRQRNKTPDADNDSIVSLQTNASRASHYSEESYSPATFKKLWELGGRERLQALRRRDTPISRDDIYEGRFERDFAGKTPEGYKMGKAGNDLPEGYEEFEIVRFTGDFPSYDMTTYIPGRDDPGAEMSHIRRGWAEKLAKNREFFNRKARIFWLHHHLDPAYNDREYLAQHYNARGEADSQVIRGWKAMTEQLKDGELELEQDWPVLTVEEHSEDFIEYFNNLPAQPKWDLSRKEFKSCVLVTPPGGPLGITNELLEARRHFIDTAEERRKIIRELEEAEVVVPQVKCVANPRNS